ncbi:hypothetical protein AOQ88_01905 [Candidatus Riesia sp. GBBU]|nr:hypothetical protein AOQ88_01905 [Candidatus Riesia sp. GBBU]
MKILIDEDIPYNYQLFEKFGKVKTASGRYISNEILKDVDILIVRSVTKVDRNLLIGSNVKFVGTATSGFDHVDHEWLKENDIFFSVASGCNSVSVVEYVISAMLYQANRNCFDLREKTVGIVGFGNIGSLLNKYLKSLKVKTLICDPPLYEKEQNNEFVSLEKLLSSSDIISFHSSLNSSEKYSSYHLLDQDKIDSIHEGKTIINTSRGSIIDNKALYNSLKNNKKIDVILDVWENEPNILLPLLSKVLIGTPHIAGCSLEGKIRGIIKIFLDLNNFLGKKENINIKKLFSFESIKPVEIDGDLDQKRLYKLICSLYSIEKDNELLDRKSYLYFDTLRKFYSNHREWSSLEVNCNNTNTANLLHSLGFLVRNN